MIVQHVIANSNKDNHNSSKHRKDDIINVTKAAAKKSILIQTTARVKLQMDSIRQKHGAATSVSTITMRGLQSKCNDKSSYGKR